MRFTMIGMFALALAAMSAQAQDNEAVKLHKAMVQKITAAKSLKVVIEMQGTPFGASKTEDPKFKQTIWVAEGNKVRWEFEQAVKGKDKSGLAVCDGKQLAYQASIGKVRRDAAATFSKRIVDSLANHGCWFAISALNDALDPDAKPFFPLLTSNFKLGAKEKVAGKDTQTVIYTVREKDRPGFPQVATYTIWLDTKTQLPAKVLLEADGFRVEETYVEWQLDAKIDAKLFELPK